MSKSKASPLVLGPSSPVFPGPFKKNLLALFRMNGEKVQFTQMKHAWAHMVQVKYRGKDGSETDLKLHFYTEILASEYDNIESDECRIIGMPPALHQSVFSDCRGIRWRLDVPPPSDRHEYSYIYAFELSVIFAAYNFAYAGDACHSWMRQPAEFVTPKLQLSPRASPS